MTPNSGIADSYTSIPVRKSLASSLVANLIKRGVKVELCGASGKVHNYVNADLLPDIKINADAMARTIDCSRRLCEDLRIVEVPVVSRRKDRLRVAPG